MLTPGFYPDVLEADYHADRESLSVSGAKVLLKAPALFRWQQDHPVHKDVFDFGSAAHALVLGRGMESIYVAPFDDWKTKAAQVEKATGRADGLSVILPSDWLIVCDMADQLASHSKAMELLADGEPEVSAYAPDDETGVLRRCRFDLLGTGLLTDYKTTICSEPREFVRSAARFGYHMQHPWYLDLARDLGHPARGFVFIAQEKAAPYLVTVIELPPELVLAGRERNAAALQRFRDCREIDLWPGYVPSDRIATADAPAWALNNYDMEMTA